MCDPHNKLFNKFSTDVTLSLTFGLYNNTLSTSKFEINYLT